MKNLQFPNQLAAKVGLRNELHKWALSKLPLFREALRPFVGQKINLATGGFSKKVKDVMPDVDEGDFTAIIKSDGWRVSVYFRGHASYPDRNGQYGIATYADVTLTVAEFENTWPKTYKLDKIVENQQLRTDYTEAEVLAVRKELRDAETVVNSARCKLSYFGEYDN